MLKQIVSAATCAVWLASAPVAQAQTVANKGYLIAEINVTDPTTYQRYMDAVGRVVSQFGGVYAVRAGKSVSLEGAALTGRFIVIEFASPQVAQAFYNSPEYQALKPIREQSATSRVFLIEGAAKPAGLVSVSPFASDDR
jgi:uncharacterized protein (DUF1330 family)